MFELKGYVNIKEDEQGFLIKMPKEMAKLLEIKAGDEVNWFHDANGNIYLKKVD